MLRIRQYYYFHLSQHSESVNNSAECTVPRERAEKEAQETLKRRQQELKRQREQELQARAQWMIVWYPPGSCHPPGRCLGWGGGEKLSEGRVRSKLSPPKLSGVRVRSKLSGDNFSGGMRLEVESPVFFDSFVRGNATLLHGSISVQITF